MNIPESMEKSEEINNGEIQSRVQQFIIENFINTNDNKDRLHTDTICRILNDSEHKTNVVEAANSMDRIGIGKYNSNFNIDKCRKGGFEYFKYLGEINE